MSNRWVMPGDVVHVWDGKEKIVMGPGLRQDDMNVIAMKWGEYWKADGGKMWIEQDQKRYWAVEGEKVIGVIVEKHADNYRVDIGAGALANLNVLSFEGATKRHRPMLQVGTLVYTKLTSSNIDMELEVVCVDESSGKSLGLGELVGGMMIRMTLMTCRYLLRMETRHQSLLKAIGKCVPFEMTIGMNGRIWINANSVLKIMFVVRALRKGIGMITMTKEKEKEKMTKTSDLEKMVRTLWENVQM